jgi:hypothetical protein
MSLTNQERANEPTTTTSSSKHTIDQLFQQSLKYRRSDQFKHFIGFIAKFNHYSRYNSMLVYLQNPAVTFFGSTSYWKKNFNRRIKPDAKPLIILAPNGPVILAYDIFDTNGSETPEEFIEEGMKSTIFNVKGDFRNEYLDSLLNFANEYSIRVQEKELNFFNAGAITTIFAGKLEVYLKKGHTKAQHFTTLCHELAHLLLGHTGHIELSNIKSKKKTRLEKRILNERQRELEAETVCYLVCLPLSIEPYSLEYLAGYITNENDWAQFSYESVIKVADRLKGLIN